MIIDTRTRKDGKIRHSCNIFLLFFDSDYSERWCRLRGNLLFMFKDRNLLPEPQGVIILEQCFIKEEYAEVKPHAFCIG